MLTLDVNRREFLKIAAGAGAAFAMPASGHTAGSSKMIGIQVGAISFVDEGTEKVLDVLHERACVNTLFLAVFTYGRGIAGRQIPGQPLPDHGKQEYDLNYHGGNFATPHPQYYKNTVIKDTRAPDHGNLDILGFPAGSGGFDQLLRTSEEMEIAKGLRVRVASVEDLIKMKRAAARAKDLIEVEILSALQDEIESEP